MYKRQGLGYGFLYSILPYADVALNYHPFTLEHIVTQMQLLILAALAFVVLQRFGAYPSERPGTILDFDWSYRKVGFSLAIWSGAVWVKIGKALQSVWSSLMKALFARIEAAFSPQGVLSRGPLTGGMAVWAGLLLGVVLLASLFSEM